MLNPRLGPTHYIQNDSRLVLLIILTYFSVSRPSQGGIHDPSHKQDASRLLIADRKQEWMVNLDSERWRRGYQLHEDAAGCRGLRALLIDADKGFMGSGLN